MKIAIVTAAMRSGERGGAEAFYDGLTNAFRAAGHNATQLPVLIDESTFDHVLESYQRCYELDTTGFDLVISTKAPTYLVRHPRHISYLVHTLRAFYDQFEREYRGGTAAQHRQRRLIHQMDKAALQPGRVAAHFAIGHSCYRRLVAADAWWSRIPFSVLHLPPVHDRFRRPHRGEHVLIPGRLHRWKRTDLAIRAFGHVPHDVPLLIVGTGEDENLARKAASGDRRVRFLGAVTDEELLDLYARAIVIPFIPVEEDYGLVTIEAFRSRKPVITCTDSGEPLEFVKDGITGFVVDPDERAIASRIDYCIAHPQEAAAMGRRGHAAVSDLAWESIVTALLAAGRTASRGAPEGSHYTTSMSRATKVTVLDMQPIAPAIGGGRLRLLGLYHALGTHIQTTYVGSYDWPGEQYREHKLSDTLTEIDVPLSSAHFAAADEWKQRAGGKTVIDTAFPLLAHHSPEYLTRARSAAQDADIVVCSHPWVYPSVQKAIDRRRQLLVYDSQNVESVLRYSLLGDTEAGRELVRQAAACERELCRDADLVLACSHEDRRLFHELYGLPFARCLVVPNGTFAGQPISSGERATARNALALNGPTAVFVGARYQPNEEAARFITNVLAAALPDVTFVICGGVGDSVDRAALQKAGISNVRVTGVIDDSARRQYLAGADVAINPMFSGSGTNIKMFDFMAAGLPTISTARGARGIRPAAGHALHVCEASAFPEAVRRILADQRYRSELAAAGRQLVCETYAWERVSPHLGGVLTRYFSAGLRRPFFSVVVPTYDRQAHLPALLDCLARQACTDFEVILVDQSESPWQLPGKYASMDVVYVHTDVKGATRARNLGAAYARGDVLAFTDDDCRPYADWLANAQAYFADRQVVGVEGLILSDKLNDPSFRTVTNAGFEGLGFMTANLFLRRETFNAIDGFDERFDRPHFREDTDLAWRASALGSIPFARNVCVFHPPHPRSVEREGTAARTHFFEKDALLLKKHPERYRTLFLAERHYAKTAGFLEHFTRGGRKYSVNVETFLASLPGAHWIERPQVMESSLTEWRS